jgi:hypothetical protein
MINVYVLIEHTGDGDKVMGVFNNELSALRRQTYFQMPENERQFTIKEFTVHTQDMD